MKISNQDRQSILVDMTSVEVSQLLSKMLKREIRGHKVVNIKYHQQKAEIIVQAGQNDPFRLRTKWQKMERISNQGIIFWNWESD
jgi:preprotein translocase subunit SecA